MLMSAEYYKNQCEAELIGEEQIAAAYSDYCRSSRTGAFDIVAGDGTRPH